MRARISGVFFRRPIVAAARAATLALVVVTSGCGRPHYVVSSPADLAGHHLPSGVTRVVVLVSIDGLRPDAIAAFEVPTLNRLMREGSYSLSASTITPSKTLPSHTSMLTGEPPERHQVLWNNVVSAKRDEIDLPNVFSVARSRGYRTAAFFSKAKFQPLQRPGTLDYSQAPGGWFGRWLGRRTMTDVENYLERSAPNLLFVHLADPDAAGHASGWMSERYGRAVIAADQAVTRLVAAADRSYGAGNYTLIVTADHGGHDRDHGSHDPRDVTIPWIAWGKGVRAGDLGSTPIQTMDTAATVLWLLGVPEPNDWAGSPIVEAFHAGATRAD
jgi:predicted AlkP superfamily pyrophosphatase or phosphodiesterase